MSARRLACRGLWLFLLFFKNENQAQVITETFGAGPDPISIDFVSVGNPGNAADRYGVTWQKGRDPGSVGYEYFIGKYEIRRSDIEKANIQGNLGISLYDTTYAGWSGGNKPATSISWREAARFVNYLNTSSGYLPAYKITIDGSSQSLALWNSGDEGYNPNNPFRNALSKYVIPSIDEWHKAAFYDPIKNTYSKYPTGSDEDPVPIQNGLDGTVYGQSVLSQTGPADVFAAGSLSSYGTMAQGGNALEWMETSYDLQNDDPQEVRWYGGGSWVDSTGLVLLQSKGLYATYANPDTEYFHLGFRVASVPEPSSFSLALFAFSLSLLYPRRREK